MSYRHKPTFFIYRNKNKHLIQTIMNNLDWEANDDTKDLSKADSLSTKHLEAMRFVARMKEAADKCGAGFVGGFISPTGERFMMSNMESDEVQRQAIEQQLDSMQMYRLKQEYQESDEDQSINDQGIPQHLRNMIRQQMIRKIIGDFED